MTEQERWKNISAVMDLILARPPQTVWRSLSHTTSTQTQHTALPSSTAEAPRIST